MNEILKKSSGKMQKFMVRFELRKADGCPMEKAHPYQHQI